VKKKILVAPLDWGLGHATRCIPIIRILLEKGFEVCIATSGLALPLLKQEFPQLAFFELPSYQAQYSARLPLMLKVFLQSPYFLHVIQQEHRIVKKLVSEQNIDVILSDNRYGCYCKGTKNIFITHQLTLLMPPAFRWLQGFVNFFNHRLILKFDSCWVPDFKSNPVTGSLTQAVGLRTTFIGMLSRFHKREGVSGTKYDLLVLLSGPEPQRSLLENLVLRQLKEYTGKVLLVRGLPDTHEKLKGIENVNHLTSRELQVALEASSLVLSRSGYTTIMDLYYLEKKAIFIPTPGQTEQEYLAKQLMEKRIAFSMVQKNFNLMKAMDAAKDFTGFTIHPAHASEEQLLNLLSNL
jgi:predicted glycosyltransferase